MPKRRLAVDMKRFSFGEVLEWLRVQFPDKFGLFEAYSVARYRKRFIYFSELKKGVDPDRFPQFASLRS